MQIAVRSLLGLAGVPTHRTSATHWLIKAGVPILTLEGDARRPEAVALTDLPRNLQLAVSNRDIEAEGLEPGKRDEVAHGRLEEATPKMQGKAALQAKLAVFMVKRDADGWKKADIFAAVRKVFGAAGTSDAMRCDAMRCDAMRCDAMMADRHRELSTASEGRAQEKVNAAFRQGYIHGGMRDWALALSRSDEAAFDTFLQKPGPTFGHLLKNQGEGRTPPVPARTALRSEAADSICAQLGLAMGSLTK